VRRGRLTTLLVASGTIAVIVGAGFAVQAGGLGRPSSNPLLVARTLAKLLPYTISRTSMRINGRALTAVCTEHWQERRRIQEVTLDPGPTLVEIGNRLLVQGRLAHGEFELAGCARPLRKWLTSQLNHGRSVQVVATRFDDQPVLGIRFPAAPLKLEVFISREGLFPVALSLHGRGVWGMSKLAYGADARMPLFERMDT
jgi:hypothetical protein